jgi:hypothetical protein
MEIKLIFTNMVTPEERQIMYFLVIACLKMNKVNPIQN